MSFLISLKCKSWVMVKWPPYQREIFYEASKMFPWGQGRESEDPRWGLAVRQPILCPWTRSQSKHSILMKSTENTADLQWTFWDSNVGREIIHQDLERLGEWVENKQKQIQLGKIASYSIWGKEIICPADIERRERPWKQNTEEERTLCSEHALWWRGNGQKVNKTEKDQSVLNPLL